MLEETYWYFPCCSLALVGDSCLANMHLEFNPMKLRQPAAFWSSNDGHSI
jgi:hypothetical protein